MKKIYLILLLLIALFFEHCSDMLDTYPQDKLSDHSFWNKPDDFRDVANNFYLGLKGMNLYDYDSDLAYGWSTNTESSGTYVAPDNWPEWDNNYKRLREINYLLMKAEDYPNPEEIEQYVAIAHFFRAYIYHDLLYFFGGVPIIKVPLDINSDELMAPRNSREEVVQFILDELDAAIPYLLYENEISTSQKGRISVQAAQALKARVALYEGTWQKFRGNIRNDLLEIAISESKNVINTNTYSLFNALGDSSYKYLFIIEDRKSNPGNFTKKDNHEFILASKYAPDVRMNGVSHALIEQYHPTRKIADMYLCKNGLPIENANNNQYMGKLKAASEFQNRDLRMINTIRVPGKRYYSYGGQARDYSNPDAEGIGIEERTPGGGYQAHKFMTERPENVGEQSYDYPVIRYPEVLLIYAESTYERYGSISDDDLNLSINLLRERSGIVPLTNSFVNSNGLDMRTEIRRERTVELYMEDFRLDDLKRWEIAVEEMTMPLLSILYTGTEIEEKYPDPNNEFLKDSEGYIIHQTASERKFSEKYYLHPIPLKQIFLNPNLEQNPEW
jgi:starch-binding outer membrane protein, SusD/RagB family